MRNFTQRVLLWCSLSVFTGLVHAQTSTGIILMNAEDQRKVITADSTVEYVNLQHLTKGATYAFVIPPDIALGGCIPDASVVAPTAEQISYDPVNHNLRFKALSSIAQVLLTYSCSWSPNDPPRHYVSIACESCTLKHNNDAHPESGVLEVSSASAEDLVRQVFIGGDCFDVTGVNYSGGAEQIGEFTNGITNVGFSSGVIMATGDINVAPGPNDQNGAGGGGAGGGDGDLATIASGPMFDVAVIEFDFTPTQTPLTFDYVFASEEYCEYVNTAFNDVFGFFISGPGIAGTQNLAVIPMTNTPITINTVNHVTNSGLYVHNTPAGLDNCENGGVSGTLPPAIPATGPATQELQYDGFTRKMTAVAQVIPCSTYHIKLAIADVGDGLYDSAVFLKAGSFSGGGNASIDWLVDGQSDVDEVVEGCGTVQILVDRLGANTTAPLPVSFTITGTATSGADFSPIPATIIIPAGQDQVLFPVNIVNDLIAEGAETIILTLNSPCSCLHPQEILTILDYNQMVPAPDTVTICGPSGTATVGVNMEGGVEPYTYQWSNGMTDQNITVFASNNTNYTVTITDACGKTKTAVARVILTPAPLAQLLPPAPQLCPGGTGTINVNLSGHGPFEITYSINGGVQNPISGITQIPYPLTINAPGLYQLVSVIDSFGCPGTTAGAVNVTVSTLALSGVVSNATCSTSNNGSINTTVSGGQGPFHYHWAGPSNIGDVADPVNILPGNYTVTITDNIGCTNTQAFTLVSPPVLALSSTMQGVNCYMPNGGSIDLTVSGGTPNYTYLWSNGSTLQDPVNLANGVYTVTVSDMNGCTQTNSASVPGNFTPPLAAASVSQQLTCAVSSIPLDGAGSSSGQGFGYHWTANPGNILSGNNTLAPVINQGGTYTLVVMDSTNGCTATASVVVTPNNTPPLAFAGSDALLTCVVHQDTLNGSGSSSGNNFLYHWTASGGGNILSGDSTLTPVVNANGLYTLTVTNTANGCTSTDQAIVGTNTAPPTAVVAPGGQITCTAPAVQLNGGGSSTGASFIYSWSSSSGGGISQGGNTLTPTVTSAGTYTLLVTNAVNGCTATAATTVTTNANVPTAIAAPQGIITCSVLTVPVNGTGSSSGPGFNYQWNTTNGQIVNGQGTLSITAGLPGTYTLIVTNTANNCTASYNVLVDSDLAPPQADAGAQQVLTCTQPFSTLDGSASSTGSNYTYQWTAVAGGNFISATDIQNPQINQPGTYQLVVTNTTNGCTSSDQVVVMPDASQPMVQIAAPATLNCNVNQITLNAAGSSTGATFMYQWSGPGIVSADTIQNIQVDQPGNYTLLITNSSNGCTSDQTVVVPQDIVAPPADAGPDHVLNCNNPQLQIGGSGNPSGNNYAFSWSGPGILSGGTTVNPVVNQSGTYTFVVTNLQNGCTQTDQVVMTADFTPPQALAGPGFQLTCTDMTYTLQSSGSTGANFTYQWSTANGSFTTPTDILSPTVDGAGTYTLLVTNTTNGCTTTSSVQITQAADVPIAVANNAPTLTCAVTSLTLSGAGSSTGPQYQYQWVASGGGVISNGANTLNPVITEPGTYTLEVMDTTNHCISNSSVVVQQNITPPVMDAGATPTITCAALTVHLAGSVTTPGNFSYLWQAQGSGHIVSGNTTLTPTVDSAGTYLLTVTSQSNGCTSTDLATVNIDQAPPVTAIQQPATLTCAVQTINLNATGSSSAGTTYSWTTNGGHFVNQTNPLSPVVDQPGAYTLQITSTTNGCTSSQTVTVPQDIVHPVANAGTDGLLTCAVTTLHLDGSGSSQNGNYAYQWSAGNGGIIINGGITLSPTVSSGGTYTLVVTNNDNGCTSTDQAIVNTNSTPPAVAIATPGLITCLVSQVTLNGSGSQSGNGISYAWTTAGGNISGATTGKNCVATASGVYTLTVSNSTNGCTASQSVTVTDNIVLPDAEAGPPFTLTCTVNQVTLAASGSTGAGFAYAWSTVGGNVVSNGASLSPVVNHEGTYTLTVTNTSTGCTQTDYVDVFRDTNVPTDVAYNLVRPGCKDNDGQITFTTVTGGTGPYLYSIDGGHTYSPALDFAQIAPGNYSLAIQDANGCEYAEPLTVPKAPDPGISIDPSINIVLGDSISLHAVLPQGYPLSLVDTVIWTPLDGLTFANYTVTGLLNPGAKPFKPTEYLVTLISKDGCEASDRVLIRVDNEPHIYIPNAFSPWHEDGENDVFYIFADDKQILKINKFQVFDRWGEMVFTDTNFQPNDPAHGWNGRLRGQLMTPAVFVYYAEIELIDGRVLLYKGDVTLVR